ncbi:MAG: hypothetical protein IPM95_13805 [Sphingobacteriales bacterium]|nr:hypothetical protein [Sphingobacteriales bacterium]
MLALTLAQACSKAIAGCACAMIINARKFYASIIKVEYNAQAHCAQFQRCMLAPVRVFDIYGLQFVGCKPTKASGSDFTLFF